MDNSKKISSTLIDRAKQNDPDAIEELMQICYPKVYAAVSYMVGNSEDAEDITQEVFIKLFKNLSNLKSNDAFSGWVRIITANECKLFYKKNKNNLSSYDDDSELQNKLNTDEYGCIDQVPHETVDHNENDRLLLEVINSLPEKYSRILILRYYGELSYQEIADILELNEGTVKSRLSTAKLKLKSQIFMYEKKHCVRLHTGGFFGNITEIIRQAFSYASLLSGTSSSAATTITSIASTGLSTAVSTTISHAAATRISALTAAVSVAACVSITAINLNTDSLQKSDDPSTDSSVVSEVQQNSDEESSQAESSLISEQPESSAQPAASQEPSTIVQISTVYVYQEPSVVSSPPETRTERVIEYRDREVIVERSVEPSIIYVEKEASSQVQPAPAANTLNKDYSGSLIGEGSGFTFRIYPNANEATLMTLNDNYTGSLEELVLPSECEYNGVKYPVTRMKSNLLKSIDKISLINNSLRSIYLPKYLTEIPDRMFYRYYNNLEEIHGGKYVTKIGTGAFYNTKLKEIDFPKQFPNVMQIGEEAFSDCKELTKVVLPKECIELSAGAFSNSPKLSDITLYCDTQLGESNISVLDYDNLYYPGISDTYHLIMGSDKGNGVFKIGFRPSEYSLHSEHSVFDGNSVSVNIITKTQNVYVEYDQSIQLANGKEYSLSLNNTFPVGNLYVPEGITAFRESISMVDNIYLPASMTDFDIKAMDNSSFENIYISVKGRSQEEISRLLEQFGSFEKYEYADQNNDYLHYHTVNQVTRESSYDNPEEETEDSQNFFVTEIPYEDGTGFSQ